MSFEFEFDRLLQAIDTNTAQMASLLKTIPAAIAKAIPGSTPAAAGGTGGGTLPQVSLPLPILQLDVLRAVVAADKSGFGVPNIAGLPLTAPAGGSISFQNDVPSGDVWVVVAKEYLTSTLHDPELTISASVDVPSNLLIPEFPVVEDIEIEIVELGVIRANLAVEVINGTTSTATVSLITQYAAVPQTSYDDTVATLVEYGYQTYKNAAQAIKAAGGS